MNLWICDVICSVYSLKFPFLPFLFFSVQFVLLALVQHYDISFFKYARFKASESRNRSRKILESSDRPGLSAQILNF
ncbi:hypothetical protein LEP1GSC193_2907 [Leptospira alstonii serovar Pingchang str. 80-412]|uniref:Uncharacterized protein n=2 Tax=Leptospira alstonii TaxID=28452 RepID=M6D566_9LEPT|nr:hypothetical protein LEP1GSC194_3257 [Leptospira alstonii serovar Sichuan str. 79601]EQA81611.1 hypothetical protein LEP1GSC193_2907 [Leptospira alstonii serovar Pingchang str. 80-412]